MFKDLAIDLGTANTLVYIRGRGIVLNEPTVIALNERTGDVLAMGREAWAMIGRTPGYIVAHRPLRRGAISDFDITERLIKLILQRVGVRRFSRPRALFCVPSAITEVERRAVEEAALAAGARSALLLEQPMAAAIGAQLPIDQPVGNCIVDIGGGTTEVAVISMGGIVASRAIRVGGFDLDEAIQRFIRREYGMAVGERTAENIKIAVGSAYPTPDEPKADIRGRELVSGMPKNVVVSAEEIRAALRESCALIVEAVREAMSEAPPEISHDVLRRGIYLTGGGGLLRGLDSLIAAETGIPVQLTEQPLETVCLGAGRALDALDELRAGGILRW